MVKRIKENLSQRYHQQADKTKEWWSQLSLQERRMVSVGGSIVAIFLVYALIWSPALTGLDKMRKHIKTGAETLAWMQSADIKIKKLAGSEVSTTKAVTPVALMSVLQKEIAQTSLGQSLKQLKQVSNDTVQIDFKQASFDEVVKFLTKTLKSYKVSVDQFSAKAGAKPGLVDVELILRI